MKKYKTLILIGNGFDQWQDLPTAYEEFRKYYAAHIRELATSLGCTFYPKKDTDGAENEVTAVELIYGDPFAPSQLEGDFFWNLESRMDKLDDQLISYYFGREAEDLKRLDQAVKEALMLLKRCFCDWVRSIEIDVRDSGFRFPPDSYVINFNYTDTVEKRFGVPREDVFHIHGTAADPELIIVGHATHPEMPFEELVERHFMKPMYPDKGLPRIDSLYAIEKALYQTDKHVQDQIDRLCAAWMRRGVHAEDFEQVYVLGHSFSPADMEYFSFIDAVTRCGCDYDRISAVGRMDKDLLAMITLGGELGEELLLNLIVHNMQYAMHHRERSFPDAADLYPELTKIDEESDTAMEYFPDDAAYAVKQRFWMEQAKRTRRLMEQLAAQYGVPIPEDCHSILDYMDYVDGGHDRRKRNAVWHISYFSNEDKKRVVRVMKDLYIKRYRLYGTIDECIGAFRVKHENILKK